MLGDLPKKTPFQQGKEDAAKGKTAPSYPTPDSSWADKLYFRGFQSHKLTPK